MTEPKRPWWRKKRIWASGAVVAVVAYFASLGPVYYCWSRDWISHAAYLRARKPLALYNEYLAWWYALGRDPEQEWEEERWKDSMELPPDMPP